MEVKFTEQAKTKFKEGLEEFKRQVDECAKGGGTTIGTSPSNIVKIFDEALQEIEYKSNVQFGTGNLATYCGIGFVRNDILRDDYVNSSKFTHKNGIYIFFEYIHKDKEFKLCIGIGNKEKNNCKAMHEIKQKREKGEFEKQYGRDFDTEKIANDFIEFANDFNRFAVDDFKVIENKGKSTVPDELNKIPLNQILYGPPGTGKTYSTIDKALEILQSFGCIDEIPESREEKREIFNAYKEKGQIEFITFHQSFSYEEFVEGIKPVFVDENGDEVENSKNMIYKVKDGIFKEICEKALENLRQANINDGQIDAGDVFDGYVEKAQEKLTKEEIVSFGKNNVKVVGVVDFKNSVNAGLRCTTSSGKTPIWITRKMVLRDYDNYKNGAIKEAKDIISNYTGKKHAQSWWYLDFYAELKRFEDASNIQTNKKIKEPYILIIDEINRGNISKILGELITLIEESKRIGKDEELKVRLPYSTDEFGVPSNLYIIGTMNTADRSIALLDTALRRRFEFVEMMPDFSLLSTDCEGVNLQELLKAMNDRIEFLLDREHTIGHSFFINVTSIEGLKEIFAKKIIPLLQEYFYEDYAKIDAVLNGNKMVEKVSKSVTSLFQKSRPDDLEDKTIYNITPLHSGIWDNPQSYKNIYDSKVENSQDSNESNENGE